jgi:hypothetical protein
MSARRPRYLDAEREQARGSGLRRMDFAWLLDQGVPGRLTAWASPGGFDLLMRDAVVFGRGRRFEFARLMRDAELDRVVAYTLLVRDAAGAAIDVAAWHPRTGRLATWLGRTGLLGLDFPCPATADDPLVVYSDPRVLNSSMPARSRPPTSPTATSSRPCWSACGFPASSCQPQQSVGSRHERGFHPGHRRP